MIDKYFTALQGAMVSGMGEFFYERKKSPLYLGAYVVMPLTIGFAGFLDYFKLPLAAIESVAIGIFAGVLSPLSNDAAESSSTNFIYSRKYFDNCVSKLKRGWKLDLECMFESFKNPLYTMYAPASYYGKYLIYLSDAKIDEIKHPSISERTQITDWCSF
jgi:hypothetical protein